MFCVHWESCIYPVQVVSLISGNIITIILGWIASFVINKKNCTEMMTKKVILKYNMMILYQTYYV